MNISTALKKYPRECRIVVESSSEWKFCKEKKKYKHANNNRNLNKEDLGWISLQWILNNLDKLGQIDIATTTDSEDLLIVLLEIISKFKEEKQECLEPKKQPNKRSPTAKTKRRGRRRSVKTKKESLSGDSKTVAN